MKLLLSLSIVFLALTSARPLRIIAYPYIPALDTSDPNFLNLKAFLEAQFNADTGLEIDILFDNINFSTDTYTPSLVQQALGPAGVDGNGNPFGGYDLQEIDSIILGYLVDRNVITQTPSTVSFEGFSSNVMQMVTDNQGTAWAHPSYTCTNVYFSYDASLSSSVSDGSQFLSWMNSHRAPGQKGWTGDLSSEPDLRLQYLDGWADAHPTENWHPKGYSYHLSQTDLSVVNNIQAMRDACVSVEAGNNVNHCTDGVFYFEPDVWFGDFAAGNALVLQGFPEYTSDILAAANTDPLHPTRLHYVSPAAVGGNSGSNKPFLFTDAWVISRTNCDSDCMTTATTFLNWQRTKWASMISLGKDLSPVRPRFLAVAYDPFYSSSDVTALPAFAQSYYNFYHNEILRARSLDTARFWDNEVSQSATLEQLITVGYNP